MLIEINKKIINVGFKSYCAYCSGFYDKGILSREEVNRLIINKTIDKEFVERFISRYFECSQTAHKAFRLYLNRTYRFIERRVVTIMMLGAYCNYFYNTSYAPKEFEQRSLGEWDIKMTKKRDNWFYKLIEELVQYCPKDKIDPSYLDNNIGNLNSYIEIAKFLPPFIPYLFNTKNTRNISRSTTKITGQFPSLFKKEEFCSIDIQEALSIFKENNYTLSLNFIEEDSLINSIDENGILLLYDDNTFMFSDYRFRNLLQFMPYKTISWTNANKLIRIN